MFKSRRIAVAHCGNDSAKLNAIIQSKMSTKKLELGQEKCFKIYVGKNSSNSICPDLNVHQNVMNTATSEKYLGDILASNGKIDQNIESRVNKGTGRINSIMSLLEEISFGEFHFEMAILFRESMFINSVLSNGETLYNIETKHITKLEDCDKILLTKIFGVPSTCSYEAVYLDTGCFPIRFILQGRRLMYYWTILNKDKNELVKKVFNIQSQFPTKDDWIIQIENDKKYLDINLNEDTIKRMKKKSFKKILKEKLKKKASEYLYNYRDKENRSKTKKLKSFGVQDYLKYNGLSTKEKKLFFSLRTRMVDVKTNYRNKYLYNMQCRLCENKNEEESEKHLLKCEKIIQEYTGTVSDLISANYENIYSEDIMEQISITKMYDFIFKTRARLLKS